jgi:hypothetical protein
MNANLLIPAAPTKLHQKTRLLRPMEHEKEYTHVLNAAITRTSSRESQSAGSLCRFLVVFRPECAVEWNRVKIVGVQNQSNHVSIYLQQEIRSRS